MPPAKRKRVSRDRLRQLLLEEGMEQEVLWNKLLTAVAPAAAGVKAFFEDGSSYEGLLLVGSDGASSTVRTFMCPSDALARSSLPVNFLGTSLEVTTSPIIESLLEIHPVLIRGCHPESSTYMAFCAIDSPETNGTISQPVEQQIWRVQVGLSWLYTTDDPEIPSTDAERMAIMRERSVNFDPRLKSIFYDMLSSDHSPIQRVKIEEWCPPCDRWDSFDGRITLAGDAAHTMTMCKPFLLTKYCPLLGAKSYRL
jgi:2-polyprenyl-6-methoxyphenol hydroxylase-like FAD-dependent oxidoreductase